MKFEIENFFQFGGDGKAKAGLSVKTEGGMYYDCKLVEGGSNGYFVVSNQSRSYDKKDGDKAYVNAFGALRGTPAADFFDEVAVEAAKRLRQDDHNTAKSNGYAPSEPPFNPDDDIPF